MNWLGNLLIIVGISFDVYAAMEVRGAMLAKIKPKILILTSLLFTLIQCIFFFGGYIHKAIKHEEIEEKREEMSIKTYAKIIIAGAFYTLLAGLACGLIRSNQNLPMYFWMMFGFILCTTIAVVLAGVYTGYRYGCGSRPKFYIVGAALLIIGGIWSLVVALS